MSQMIYLDYAASTPLDKRVVCAIVECLNSRHFANPSAPHYLARTTKELIEINRRHVGDLIGADSSEIIWTSGATESNNIAIIGATLATQHIGNHIITFKTEHESVLKACEYLETLGFKVSYLSPKQDGTIDIDQLKENITHQTILISVMFVNNETGVIQEIQQISKFAKDKGIILHVDATQAVGKLPIDVKEMKIDLMSFSAHKMYGPKGIGALYIDNQLGLDIKPILHGGLQEKGIRPGTLATHQIVGFGEACQIAKNELVSDLNHAYQLRSAFFRNMQGYVKANFPFEQTSPYIFNVFLNIKEEARKELYQSENIMVSSRSSCSNHKRDDFSYVLKALELSPDIMGNSYRISIGRFTTENEIGLASSILKEISIKIS